MRVMVVSVNSSERGVRLRISVTSTVKVDTLRVVVVVVTVAKLKIYLVDVEVVGTVEIITGTWLEVGHYMVWYTRVVVVVERGQ
jgi:hypothetical protein